MNIPPCAIAQEKIHRQFVGEGVWVRRVLSVGYSKLKVDVIPTTQSYVVYTIIVRSSGVAIPIGTELRGYNPRWSCGNVICRPHKEVTILPGWQPHREVTILPGWYVIGCSDVVPGLQSPSWDSMVGSFRGYNPHQILPGKEVTIL